MLTNKEKYREFCKKELNIPIFSKDWWLDAVCVDGEWDVALAEKGGNIFASMPYYMIKKDMFKVIGMPSLTQTMGPYIKYPAGQKRYKKTFWEKELMSSLIEQLPSFDSFKQSFYHEVINWLPFYWKGFYSSVRYTYIIDNLVNEKNIFQTFSKNKRKNIEKAQRIVEVRSDLSADEFYNYHKMTLAKNGENILYSYEVFKNIYNSAYKNGSATNLYSIDKNGNIHSALFIVWDKNSTYALISSLDPDFRHSGSLSLLFYEAIKIASKCSKRFDFEGSMMEYAANSYRQFGGTLKPFYQIVKTNSKLLSVKNMVENRIASLWR